MAGASADEGTEPTPPSRRAATSPLHCTRVFLLASLVVSLATVALLGALLHGSSDGTRRPRVSADPLDPGRAARLRRALRDHPLGPPEFPMDGPLARVPGVRVLGHDSMRATLRRCAHSGALAPRGLRFLVLTPTDCKAGPLPGWMAHPQRAYDVFLMDHSSDNSCAGAVAGGSGGSGGSDSADAGPPDPTADEEEAHSEGGREAIHPSDWGVEAVFSRPAHFKYQGIHAVFSAFPSLLERYDYIAFTDDDIAFGGGAGGAVALQTAFQLVAAAGLWIGQPSLSVDSAVGVGITRHVSTEEVMGRPDRGPPPDPSCSKRRHHTEVRALPVSSTAKGAAAAAAAGDVRGEDRRSEGKAKPHKAKEKGRRGGGGGGKGKRRRKSEEEDGGGGQRQKQDGSSSDGGKRRRGRSKNEGGREKREPEEEGGGEGGSGGAPFEDAEGERGAAEPPGGGGGSSDPEGHASLMDAPAVAPDPASDSWSADAGKQWPERPPGEDEGGGGGGMGRRLLEAAPPDDASAAAVEHTVRLTHFVEVMTPILHSEAVRRYMPHFKSQTHGWGLDGLWSADAVKTGRLLGVVDAVQAIHTRRTGKSSLYAKIGGKKQAATDMRILLEGAGVSPKWVRTAMHEAPDPARLLCVPPKRGSVLLRVPESLAGGGTRGKSMPPPAGSELFPEDVGAEGSSTDGGGGGGPSVAAAEGSIAAVAAGVSGLGLGAGFHALRWPLRAPQMTL